MVIPLGHGRCLFLELRTRCRHDVLGICPRCYPAESRTRRNKKLALALAWLVRISADDLHVTTLKQSQEMARHAINAVENLT
jgi:hypothetical protein